MNQKVLGENIKKYRKKHNLTQAQLAEKLLVSFQAVSNWERGMTPPDLDNLCRLSEMFHVSMDILLGINNNIDECLMIGIDGGGSQTEIVLFTARGEILRGIKLPPCNPNNIGLDKCLEILTEGLEMLLQIAPSVSGVFAGIAGANTGDNREVIRTFLNKRYQFLKVGVDCDAINVVSCKEQNSEGMALMCGVGSVLYAREKDAVHSVGGWGPLFDECGSAYGIGREVIMVALAHQEGLGKETLITNLLKKELQNEIIASLDMIYQKGIAYVASFVHLAFEAATLGDEVANKIVQKNGKYIAGLIDVAMKKYQCGKEIVVSGELLTEYKDILVPIIRKNVSCDINFIFPNLPPVYGACIECCNMMGITPEKDFRETFYRQYMELSHRDEMSFIKKTGSKMVY